jgi:hypothetical protein
MEKIEVTARFGLDGQVYPLRFIWENRTYRIDSIGRQWEADGGVHFLVMTPMNEVYELLYLPVSRMWRIKPVRAGRNMA